jgi:hypothetical protein
MIDIEKDAKALLEKAKADNAKVKAETKGAAPAPSAEKAKTEDEVKKAEQAKADEAKAKDIEIQAKKDEEILSKKDEELDETEKGRKAELVKIKQAAEDKDKKSNVQKRIDELTGKIKALEADNSSTKAEKEALRSELDGIKKQLSITPQDKVKEKVKGEMSKRRETYLKEDTKLPREERREMSKEELDEWATEDYESVQEWIAKRTFRRTEEERDLLLNEDQSAKAEAILDKQQKSAERTYAKHPELDIGKRIKELVSQGKGKEDITKTLCEENPKYKLAVEIYHENPTKYMLSENGPELIVEELEKRLSKPKDKKADDDSEKKIAALEAEIARLKNLDDTVGSERHAEPTHETEIDKAQAKLAKEVGLDPVKVGERVRKRQSEFR